MASYRIEKLMKWQVDKMNEIIDVAMKTMKIWRYGSIKGCL
jgi:hypothetical protein